MDCWDWRDKNTFLDDFIKLSNNLKTDPLLDFSYTSQNIPEVYKSLEFKSYYLNRVQIDVIILIPDLCIPVYNVKSNSFTELARDPPTFSKNFAIYET